MKKITLLLVILIFSSIPCSAFADSTEQIVDVGYYDIWRHSDGNTWQKNITPGSNVTATFSIAFKPSKAIKSINGQFLTTFKNQYTADLERLSVIDAKVSNCNYLNGQLTYTVNCNLSANENPQNIKQSWQSKPVSGLRYYIPVLITIVYEDNSKEFLKLVSGYSSSSCETVGGYSCCYYDGYEEYSTYYSLSVSKGKQWAINERYRKYDDGRIVYLYKDGQPVNY